MLVKREAILLKLESTYKTDPTPNPLIDALFIQEVNVVNEGLRMIDRPGIKPTISTDKKIFAGTLKKITFKAELKGSGTAGTAPEIGQALRACGLDETIVPSTSVTYQPVSDGHESATIYYHQDGRLKKMTGCRGTVNFSAEAGGIGYANFEFTGHDNQYNDVASPAVAYDDTVPVPFINIAFTIDGYGPAINSLTLNAGNTVSTPGDVRQETGYGEISITQRDPNGTVDPESVLVATKDYESLFFTGSEFSLTTGDVGSAAGNRWNLSANVAIRDINQGEREQLRTEQITFGCHEQTADDEWSLVFS